MKYGIIGHRSWIAKALIQYLTTKVTTGEVGIILKSELDCDPDLSEYDAVFLFAGRARPNEQERMAELLLVSKLPSLTRPPKKMIYVSSLAVERESTPYTKTKVACESIVLSQPWGYVLRPPVVFGPGQDPQADMLIPQIARAVAGREGLILRDPFTPFHLMHVDDVCHAAWLVSTWGPVQGGARILRMRPPLMWSRSPLPGSVFWSRTGGPFRLVIPNFEWRTRGSQASDGPSHRPPLRRQSNIWQGS